MFEPVFLSGRDFRQPLNAFVVLSTGIAAPNRLEGGLDMTPPFMYYSVAWVWLEYLTRGLEAAEDVMSKCLGLVQPKTMPIMAGKASGLYPDGSGTGGTMAGEEVQVKSVSICNTVFLTDCVFTGTNSDRALSTSQSDLSKPYWRCQHERMVLKVAAVRFFTATDGLRPSQCGRSLPFVFFLFARVDVQPVRNIQQVRNQATHPFLVV